MIRLRRLFGIMRAPVPHTFYVMHEGGAVAFWERFRTVPGGLKGIYGKYQEARPLRQTNPSQPLYVLRGGDSWQGALRRAESVVT